MSKKSETKRARRTVALKAADLPTSTVGESTDGPKAVTLEFEGSPVRFLLHQGLVMIDGKDMCDILGIPMEQIHTSGEIARIPSRLLDHPDAPADTVQHRFAEWLSEAMLHAEARLIQFQGQTSRG